MPETVHSLRDLEIVGYADTLSETFLPQLVAPIFRLRSHPETMLLPPFRLAEERLEDAVWADRAELDQALGRGQATLLPAVIEAKPDHDLWVDGDFAIHYAPAPQVRQTLRRLAQSSVRQAQDALARRDLEAAAQHAQAAICADDGCLNALLVKALVHRLEGQEQKVEMLADVAEAVAPGVDLIAWADFFVSLRQDAA